MPPISRALKSWAVVIGGMMAVSLVSGLLIRCFSTWSKYVEENRIRKGPETPALATGEALAPPS